MRSPENHRNLLIASALGGLTFLVMSSVGVYDFVNYDDPSYVLSNTHVTEGLSWQNVCWAFRFESCEVTSNWHPLTWLSLMADVSMFGVNPSDLHLVNLVIHVANVVLLFFVLLSMSGHVRLSAFVAVVFAIHPLHVESVAWISERKDVLSTLFVLLSILTWLKYVRNAQRRWQIVSLFCFVLSLMAKQMYVTLPFLLLLLDYWPLCRMEPAEGSEGAGEVRLPIWRLVLEKLPFLLVSLGFCCIAYFGQSQGGGSASGALGSLDEFPLYRRFLNAMVSYIAYIRQTVWPTNLAVFYPFPKHVRWVLAVFSGALLIAITVWVVIKRRRHPYGLVGWFWYLGTLVPVIGLVQIGKQRMADRYMYFPMIGLLIMIVWGISSWAANDSRRRKFLQLASLLIVTLLIFSCRAQTAYWRNTETLFTRATAVAESSLAYTKLGFHYSQTNDRNAARVAYHRALRLDENDVDAQYNLGTLLLEEGAPQKAVRHLQKAVDLEPTYTDARQNLASTYFRLGKIDEAANQWEAALVQEPDLAPVLARLGLAYSMLGQKELAFDRLNRAFELQPDLPAAHFAMGKLLVASDRQQEGIEHLLAGLKGQPKALEVHSALVQLYLKDGDSESAKRHQQLLDEITADSVSAD